MKFAAAVSLVIITALLLTPGAQARNFNKSYTASADRAFDAIVQLVQKDPRAHLIDLSVGDRLIHFRLALDPATRQPNAVQDQFAGMYVLLQVNANGTSKVVVNVTADRIYPLGSSAHRAVGAEESAYAKDFLHKLQQKLKR